MIHLQNSWKSLLDEEQKKPYFILLNNFLKKERQNFVIYPQQNHVFKAFELADLNKVKVVIIGQDPYHQPNQAHGLAFSVQEGQALPPSLKNIFKEIAGQTGTACLPSGNLERWARQGVLLLNTVLTVRQGQPNSHKGKGWEVFVNKVIQALNQKPEPIVFLLWGNNAKGFKQLITNQKHLVLQSAHPSPLSAYNGFFGNNHFVRANAFLKANNKQEIDWR